VTYAVRAGPDGPAPWVVVGTASGYAGRAAAGTPFAFSGSRWHYPEDVRHTPPDPAAAAALRFLITGPAPHRAGESASPGLRFRFAVDDGLPRVALTPSRVESVSNSTPLLPSGMVGLFAPPPPDVGPTALPRLFVAYSGSDMLLEVNPAQLGFVGDAIVYR
jgi:hypothetical protein